MKKNRQLKDMSLYEASDFWDEHDLTEFVDVQEVKDIRFSLRKKKYIGVDLSLYMKIKKKAKKLRSTEDTLINTWLKEKVEA
jgi:hypothetical protein